MSTPAPACLEQLVRQIFASLSEHGVDFVVLRNYEGLPLEIGNDLDLLVSERHRGLAEQAVASAAADCGFRLHNRAEGPHIMLYFTHEGTLAQVHVDLFADFMWRGFTMLTAEEVCARRTRGDLFDVPHPVHEAVINLLGTALYQGEVKQKYRPGIAAAFSTHGDVAAELLARMFGRPRAGGLVEAVNQGEWTRIAARAPALCRSLVLRRLRTSPFQTIGSLWRNEARRLWRRIRRPTGVSIALIGPDGSGKTTVARTLHALLAGTWRESSIDYVHWKPPVFGALHRAGPPVTAPHGAPVRGRVLSLLYFLYHAVGFAVGGHARIVPPTIRGRLVILDRYYYDFFVDQKRFRMTVPHRLVRWAFRLVRKPDLVVLLDSLPEVAQARKAEVSLGETKRQREAFLALVAWLPNAYVVDASRTADAVAADVARCTLEYMAERAAGREWDRRRGVLPLGPSFDPAASQGVRRPLSHRERAR